MKLPKITEDEFLRQVLQLAKLRGWRTAHFRPAMTKKGRWVTAVSGDGKGFPDLILVRRDSILVVELKVPPNKLTAEQQEWMDAFERTGIMVLCWTPNDWPLIEWTLA